MAIIPHDSDRRVFCLGMFRTGTVSLLKAFDILGYTNAQAFKMSDILHYEVTADTVVFFFWKELITAFPKAKFILRVRDAPAWARSARHVITDRPVWGKNPTKNENWLTSHLMMKKMWGCCGFQEDWAEKFRQYNKEVQEHFAEHCPNRLLVMDICAGDGWEKLCPFLGREIPDQPFPRLNRRCS